MSFSVYIIYSPKYNKFYIGQTSNFTERLARHNKGTEQFTAPYRPWVVKCLIEKSTRSEAMILEKKLKTLNRVKLLRFIKKYC
jgi:putative endonuclease